MKPLYTVKEAAEFLKVAEATIYRAIKAGAISYMCAGKRAYRFTEEDLLAYLTKSATPATPAEPSRPILKIT